MPADTDRRLTIAQAAAQAGCHRETVRRAIRAGELEATRDRLAPGSPLLVTDSAFKAWVAKRRGPA